MDGSIVFHQNGLLYFRSNCNDTEMVPLLSLEQHLNLTPSQTVLRFMNRPAVLDTGTTVGSFLQCLYPWREQFADLTDRDVSAYIAELRRPSGEENRFDRIEIRNRVGISRSMVHDPIPDDVDFMEWINRDREIVWDDKWEVDVGHDIVGYVDGDPANYSMSGNIHGLKNVPLVINRQSIMVESGPGDQRLFKELPSTYKIGKMTAANVDVEDPVSWQTLVQTVVCNGLWHSTPQGANNFAAMLKGMVDTLDEEREAAAEATPAVALTVVGDAPPTDTPTIVLRPGVFDSVIEHHRTEQEEWDEISSAIRAQNQYPIYIGKVVEDLPADDRAFGRILTK